MKRKDPEGTTLSMEQRESLSRRLDISLETALDYFEDEISLPAWRLWQASSTAPRAPRVRGAYRCYGGIWIIRDEGDARGQLESMCTG